MVFNSNPYDHVHKKTKSVSHTGKVCCSKWNLKGTGWLQIQEEGPRVGELITIDVLDVLNETPYSVHEIKLHLVLC